MDVSVIIVNYNTLKLTHECIESVVRESEGIDYEIILVDNASTDGSKEFFENYAGIRYIYSEKNGGFGYANNLGYQSASGKYLFLLNSDTILLNNALKMFVDAMESEPETTACCGCILLDKNRNKTHSYGKFPTLWMKYKEYVVNPILRKFRYSPGNREYDYARNSDYVDRITGADLFIRKDVADRYGLFDERYFMYFEETDLQKRYSLKGLRSKIVDGPEIVHYAGQSTVKIGSWIGFSSMQKYLRRWNPGWKFAIYYVGMIVVRIPWVLIFEKKSWADKKKEIGMILRCKGSENEKR